MDITYKLLIDSLQADAAGMVAVVHWKLIAEAGDGQAAGRVGSVEVPPPSDDATPFDQLTEQQVLDWIAADLEPRMDDLRAELAADIEQESQAPRNRRPPWAAAQRGPKLREPNGPRDRRTTRPSP